MGRHKIFIYFRLRFVISRSRKGCWVLNLTLAAKDRENLRGVCLSVLQHMPDAIHISTPCLCLIMCSHMHFRD